MSDPHTPLLDLRHVSRRRGGQRVIEDLSLRLERGEVLGLLGINGAGKSTTLSMIAGATVPTTGEVRIEGLNLAEHPRAVRQRVGWLPERAPLYDELTVTEQIDAAARLRGLPRRTRRAAGERLIERLQLGPLRRRLCGRLSQGQRQRVGLACALVHDPALVVLDEPANGLDPVQVANWRALVAELAAEHGLIVSSHVLAEIVATCSRVAILHEGRLRHEASLDGDAAALEQRFFSIATTAQPAEAAA
ncbi:MAG TPA: ABC transporter ATP-binding protein [Rhodanobacteraceae bacterium]|nr:ABC transporter ATP-binding protein [Rhodanobacteraceae bacterium]